MQKRAIDPYEYASMITAAIPDGVLFTTKSGEEVDTMVIGWGLIGNIWGKPTFTAFIRESRHSHKLAQESGEFTVNVPIGKLDGQILKVAGRQTGRKVNKVAELGLTAIESDVVGAPAFAECPLTLECKVMYTQLLNPEAIPTSVMEAFYPADVTDPDAAGANAFLHMAYYGEIVASYIVEE